MNTETKQMRGFGASAGDLEKRIEDMVAKTMNSNGWVLADSYGLADAPLTFYFTKGVPMTVLFDIDSYAVFAYALAEPAHASFASLEEMLRRAVAGRKFVNEQTQMHMLTLQLQEAFAKQGVRP